MKSEDEIWREYQRVREMLANHQSAGNKQIGLLQGAQQALGWALDQLRSPSDADTVIRRYAMHNRKRAMMERRDRERLEQRRQEADA